MGSLKVGGWRGSLAGVYAQRCRELELECLFGTLVGVKFNEIGNLHEANRQNLHLD